MTIEPSVIFGHPEKWDLFRKRHSLFFEKFPNLQKAIEIAFLRSFDTSPTDRVVFFSGKLCVEDFKEILLLCGNGYGYGIGAMKILRGMFERAVTARYLHLHPGETSVFLDFYWVTEDKVERKLVETYGKQILDGYPEREKQRQKTTEMRKQVKNQFVRKCKKCGYETPNFTWTTKDTVTMANEVGLGKLVLSACSLPTQMAHSTVHAMQARLKERQDGGLTFDENPSPNYADMCLSVAHGLLLNILFLQQEHFKIKELDQLLQQCRTDLNEIIEQKQSSTATE